MRNIIPAKLSNANIPVEASGKATMKSSSPRKKVRSGLLDFCVDTVIVKIE